MRGADILDRLDIETDVLPALGIPAPRWGRIPAPWRETRDANVSIDRKKNVWYDHARNEGGGILDFVTRVAGGTRADALEWCARLANVSLDRDGPTAPAAPLFDAAAAQAWRRAMLDRVERWLDDHSELLWAGPDDPPEWLQDRVRELTKLRESLRTMSLRQLGAAYEWYRTRDPKRAARLVRVGMDDGANAEFWTTVIVRLLEAADPRPERGDAWEPVEVAA